MKKRSTEEQMVRTFADRAAVDVEEQVAVGVLRARGDLGTAGFEWARMGAALQRLRSPTVQSSTPDLGHIAVARATSDASLV